MDDEPPPFGAVVGCGRSGTTLVRAMLDSHPLMAVPGESPWLPFLYEPQFDADRFVARLFLPRFRFERRWGLDLDTVRAALAGPPPARSYAEAVRRIHATYAAAQGKPRYADKTPLAASYVPRLARWFPEMRFVHVLRDGRDVALSLLEAPFGPTTVGHGAVLWDSRVRAARAAGATLGPDRYLEVRYEHLVSEPRRVLASMCEFLDLPFDEAMLRYPDRAEELLEREANPIAQQGLRSPPTLHTRDWRSTLSPAAVELFEAVAGPTLEAVGYPRLTRGSGLKARAHAAAARLAHRVRLLRRRRRARAIWRQ